MIHRIARGRIPPKPHTVFEPDGKLAFEHAFTRRGFDGVYTLMYHRQPPHWVESDEDRGRHPGLADGDAAGELERRHYQTTRCESGGSAFLSRRLLLSNPDLGVWIARPAESDPTLIVNADGDELIYVHRGRGRVECPLGALPFAPEEYVFVPRGMPYRMVLEEPAYLLVLEGRSYIDLPKQFRNPGGQLTMDAPYTHRDFREPEWPDGGPESLGAPRRMLVQKHGCLTAYEQTHDPFDVIGWDGQVWPFAFPIRAYQPKTGLIHLPPTIHITFAGGGFVVCSFVPRLLDYHERAIPCPYAHSSPDCDEIIFYSDGDFTSRRGIEEGSISLHPTGVPHGPHPGRYEGSIGVRETTELAVMVDTFKPLLPTPHARAIEEADYHFSWVRGERPAEAR